MTSIDCVRFICKHYRVPMQNIFTESPIVDALTICGFYACEMRTGMKGLSECPMPAVIQTIESYLVVTKANSFHVSIIDGSNNKMRRIAFLDFIKIWTGLVIVIEPRRP